MRRQIEYSEKSKRDCDKFRDELDEKNLELQSIIYQKNYYEKEINFCRELKTPFMKAALNPDTFKQFKNIPLNITED